MDASLIKILKPVTLSMRHLLEGEYDAEGKWKPGDLEQRLAALGVRRDRASRPVDELGKLAGEDRHTRKVVDAYLKLRQEAGVERADAVAEFVRETAYTWANRLPGLVGQDQIQALQELFQVDLEVRTAFDVFHGPDGRVDQGHIGGGRWQRPAHEGFNTGHAGRSEVLQQTLIPLFKDRQFGEQALQPLLDVLLVFG